jgi:hypothetical protein
MSKVDIRVDGKSIFRGDGEDVKLAVDGGSITASAGAGKKAESVDRHRDDDGRGALRAALHPIGEGGTAGV